MSRSYVKDYIKALHSNITEVNFSVLSYEFLSAAITSKELSANNLFTALLHFTCRVKSISFDSSFPEGSEERTKDIGQKISDAIEAIAKVASELCKEELKQFKEAVTLITNEDDSSRAVSDKLSELGFKTKSSDSYTIEVSDTPEDLLPVAGHVAYINPSDLSLK